MGVFGCLSFLVAVVAALVGVFYVKRADIYPLVVQRAFDNYQYGVLCLEYQDGRIQYFGQNKPKTLSPAVCDASIKIVDEQQFFERVATGGNIGLGESYMDGVWQTSEPYQYIKDDSTPLGRLLYHLLHNSWTLDWSPLTMRYWVQWGLQFTPLQEWMVRAFKTYKTEEEDLRDIKYHYDIGNDFFEGYLGPTLSGSCAVWNEHTKTLEEAQNNKWSLIIKKIGIKPHHHVLDVGSGWGYMCNKIVEDTGAKCTGITLSVEQIKFSKQKWSKNLCKKELDPNERGCVEFIFKDYRKADELYGAEAFDRVSSTGMIEHVHYIRIQEYFDSLYKVVKPEAKMLIHGITLPDVYPGYGKIARSTACQRANFISKHIFPGGCIQHVDWWNEAAFASGFELLHSEHFGKHYARTLKVWYDNLMRNWQQPPLSLKDVQGYDEPLLRKHEFYLATCEAAFRATRVELTQLVYYKPKHNNRNATSYSATFDWINDINNANQND